MRNNISVGIDVGSTKVVTCIGKFEEGKIDLLGFGKSNNLGMRKGVIVDLEETVSAISASLEEAERMAGMPVQFAVVGITGPHIELEETKGVVAVSRADGEITEQDVLKAVEASKVILNKPNREILHVLPEKFIIDGHEEIKDPVGMTGIRLEVVSHIITSGTNAVKSLTRSIDQAGVSVTDLVFLPLAAAQLLLSKRQMDIGVILIDIGANTTSYAIFEEGDLIFSDTIPIGTAHITNDIAIGLRTSIDVAETMKLKYGYAVPDRVDEKEEIDLSKLSKDETGLASAKYLSEIIEARVNEIFLIIKDSLKKIDRDGTLPAGVILTGGGSKVPGIVELAKDTMCLPAQVGKPIVEISGLIDKLDDPVYACSIGLALWGKNKIGGESSFVFDVKNFNGVVDRLKTVFKHFLP